MSDQLDAKGEYGLSVIESMMGPHFAEQLGAAATSGGFGSSIARLALDYAFADVWGREGLRRRERSLVVLGVLIAQGHSMELKNHVKIAAANGLTVREIEEVLVQACPYVGFPAIAQATTAVIEALREVGIDPLTKTPEERGLL